MEQTANAGHQDEYQYQLSVGHAWEEPLISHRHAVLATPEGVSGLITACAFTGDGTHLLLDDGRSAGAGTVRVVPAQCQALITAESFSFSEFKCLR